MQKFVFILLTSLIFASCFSSQKSNNLTQAMKSKDDIEREINELIQILKEDIDRHEKIGPTLSDEELIVVENKFGKPLPHSYKTYLKNFGNGAYWLYHMSINDVTKLYHLGSFKNQLKTKIKLNESNKRYLPSDLLCLMSEDSNGGAWVWLTTENLDTGEWPLAYYMDNKLHFKVDNFTEWLRILTECKTEVIRALDVEHTLGLG